VKRFGVGRPGLPWPLRGRPSASLSESAVHQGEYTPTQVLALIPGMARGRGGEFGSQVSQLADVKPAADVQPFRRLVAVPAVLVGKDSTTSQPSSPTIRSTPAAAATHPRWWHRSPPRWPGRGARGASRPRRSVSCRRGRGCVGAGRPYPRRPADPGRAKTLGCAARGPARV
jgi:hypothetical protein